MIFHYFGKQQREGRKQSYLIADLRAQFTKTNIAFFALLLAYAVMWCGGVGAHFIFGAAPLETWWAAPVFLTLAAMITLVTTTQRANLMALFVVALGGFLAEVVGVRYGFLFGEYRYMTTLQPQFVGVPLVMMSAWLVLFAYIKQAMLGLRLAAWLEVFLSALWITAIDLLIDPLAAGLLDYWKWIEKGNYYGIPARNFLGWFAVSAILFALVKATTEWLPNLWARRVGLSIILFFSMIALAHGSFLLFAIGLLLCTVDLLLRVVRK